MKVICVDDEEEALSRAVSLCREIPFVDEVRGFLSSAEALDWMDYNRVDAALLDVRMPEPDGLTLARRIKESHPEVAVIFLTAHPEYAVEAFALHANGFCLKPADGDRLERELRHAILTRPAYALGHVTVRTFGEFEVLVDGETVVFERSAAKELLALLVDRQGGGITRKSAYAVLYEDAPYDRPAQKQFNVVVCSLRRTLRRYGVSEMFEVNAGFLKIRPEMFDCDLYRLLQGDLDAINSYRGNYMSAYAWASFKEGLISQF